MVKHDAKQRARSVGERHISTVFVFSRKDFYTKTV